MSSTDDGLNSDLLADRAEAAALFAAASRNDQAGPTADRSSCRRRSKSSRILLRGADG